MINSIKFRGKNYPYRIGYRALKKVKAELGREFEMSDDNLDYEALEMLMFYAIETGCRQAEQDFDLKIEDMEMLLDESFADIIGGIAAFSQAVDQKAATQKEAQKKS